MLKELRLKRFNQLSEDKTIEPKTKKIIQKIKEKVAKKKDNK